MSNISKVLAFLTVVLMPAYIIRFSFFEIPMTLLEVFILLTVSVVLIDCYQKKHLNVFFASKLNPYIILFLLSSLIGLFFTDDLRGGLGIFKAYFLEPIIFFYALRYVLLDEKKHTFIIRGLIISTTFICLLGLLQKLTGQFTLAPQEMILDRISGVYNSANAVALFIGPVIPFLAVLFIKHKDLYKKYFFLGLLLFFSLIIYWTKSRGGLVAELFSLAILFFGLLTLRYKEIKKYWFIILVFVAFISFVFFIQIDLLYREKTISENPVRIQNDTIQIRYATWFSTVQMLTSSPQTFLFGAGLNGFKERYSEYKLDTFPEEFQYPHNIVLTLWSEVGLLGLFSFVGLLGYLFTMLIKSNQKQIDFFALALIGSFSFIMIHGLVDVPYFKNDLSLQFWILVVLVEILTYQKIKKENI